MKFVRFTIENNKEIKQGVLSLEEVKEISGDVFGVWEYTGETFDMKKVTLLAPIQPNQIIGIGANFVADVDELPTELPEIPVFFYKPLSSVIGPRSEVVIPDAIEEVKFESELAVVIGKEARNIKEEEVFDYVFGYTIANDVTAPQYFHENGHWMVGKSFDTFTPLGPVVDTDFDPTKARIEAIHNGVKKQDSETHLMIVSMQKMISYLSCVMTLVPGDVILTGSPVGAEFLKDGDDIECRIEGIGSLKNSVVKSKNKIEVS